MAGDKTWNLEMTPIFQHYITCILRDTAAPLGLSLSFSPHQSVQPRQSATLTLRAPSVRSHHLERGALH